MSLAIWSIELYQRHISPHKGFCCAYRIAHNDLSCSEFAKRQIAASGVFKSLADIRQRFEDCKQAAKQLSEQREQSKQKKSKCDTFMDRAGCGCELTRCCAVPPPGDCRIAGASAGGCDGCACTPF